MSSRQWEKRPSSVPFGARRDGETSASLALWVEPTVWSSGMLTALHRGVKGGKWYSLMDKLTRLEVMHAAFRQVKRNGGASGVDHVTVHHFETRLEANLLDLLDHLRNGSYRPQAVRRVEIPKHPGSREKRPLGIPTVRDRVVQTAVRMVLEPIFEREFATHSYGFRPGLGCQDALSEVEAGLEEGRVWVVDADIRRYFETLRHEILRSRLRERVSDSKVLGLVDQFLRQEVLADLESWTPEEGTPQGAVCSPLLANIYLDPLDHEMADDGYRMVRYADDFVILCWSEKEAQTALAKVHGWMERMRLELHPDKTRIVDATQKGGFDFLGYHFERGYKWPSKKSLAKLRSSLRSQTRRCNGDSLEEIIRRNNQTLRGWFPYFRYSLRGSFKTLDGWLRGRLRSILRKRCKRRGRGRGADHQRWPNAFFADRGLHSLLAAYDAAGQSSAR